MRVRKKKWTQSEINLSPLLVRAPEAQRGAWEAFFPAPNPIYLELGCGKGGFLAQLAAQSPNVNFLGLERNAHCLAKALRQAVSAPGNLFFILADAASLEDFFGEGEITRVYVNFCDPWPNKKKWRKRRLTHEAFLNAYRRVLKPGGEVIFKTDSRELFDFSVESFESGGFYLKQIGENAPLPGAAKTEYEAKFAAEGRPIYCIEAHT